MISYTDFVVLLRRANITELNGLEFLKDSSPDSKSLITVGDTSNGYPIADFVEDEFLCKFRPKSFYDTSVKSSKPSSGYVQSVRP